jgi:3-phenylpropionate/cinnamic acid dioxygenase small subunit
MHAMAQPSLDDRAAIADLFARYMWALDGGDVEALVACFTEDGALQSPAVGEHRGHAAIRGFATRFAAYRRSGAQLRHVISNLLMEVDGNRAEARCYLVVFEIRNGASRLLGPGRYECILRRSEVGWRFENRLVVMDHDYVLEGI